MTTDQEIDLIEQVKAIAEKQTAMEEILMQIRMRLMSQGPGISTLPIMPNHQVRAGHFFALLLISGFLLCPNIHAGNLKTETLTITYAPTGTDGATQKTATLSAFKGIVEEVQVAASSTAGTGTYSIAYTPKIGSTAQAVASGTEMTTATKVFRPRIVGTDTAGVALTNGTSSLQLMDRFYVIDEALTFTVTNINTTVSNVIYQAVIKYYLMK